MRGVCFGVFLCVFGEVVEYQFIELVCGWWLIL